MLHAFEVADDPFGDNSVVVVAVNRSLGSDIYYCYECSQTSQPLTPCEKCRAVGYCSDTCRERDSNHRLTCYARYSAFGQPWVAVVRGEEGLTPARIKKGFVEGVARNIRDERGEKWGQEGCFPVRFARNGQVVAMEEEVAIEVSAPGLLGLTADWDHKDMVEYYDFSKARVRRHSNNGILAQFWLFSINFIVCLVPFSVTFCPFCTIFMSVWYPFLYFLVLLFTFFSTFASFSTPF